MSRPRKAVIFLAALLFAAALFLAVLWLLPYRGFRQPVFVRLRPGATTRQIAGELQRAGVVRSAKAFLLWSLLHHRQTLKAGDFRFRRAHSLVAVFQRLSSGQVFYLSFTVPEGFNRFDIARSLATGGLVSRRQFLRATASGRAVHDLDPQARTLEGYLYPATYRFAPGESANAMAAAMVTRFRQELLRRGWMKIPARPLALPPPAGPAPDPQLPGRLKKNLPLSHLSSQAASIAAGVPQDIHEWVTIASLVEKETAAAGERRLIAGVFYNRLRIGLPLQCDPTVIYAARLAGRYQGALTLADLKLNSPYNTYLHPGLPPGPIANPGRAALVAAAHPATTNDLYFVSNGHGGHRFSRTLAQQDRNIRRYLKKTKH